MTNQSFIEKSAEFGAKNYLPLPLVLCRGLGSHVWDVEGKKYLDFLSCYSALNFGHLHPAIVEAAEQQLKKLSLCSRAFYSETLSQFEEAITTFCNYESVLPMNSGSEAIETALKIARKWAQKYKKIENGNIIAFQNNFHGRTISIISFSTEALYRDGFGPYTPGFKTVPFDDISSLEKACDANTIAILIEPIQAEAGILIPKQGYLSQVRQLCTDKKILMIADEIQTGLGRTGRDFCFEHEKAKPDILVLGKSLGGGILPLSAVLSSRQVMDSISPGTHGSTFGGNPLACAVGIRALELLKKEKLSERSEDLGRETLVWLSKVKSPLIHNIRGRGLLIGIELNVPARKYCERLALEGVLCKETHDRVIRIAPPLTVSKNDLMKGLEAVVSVLQDPR